MLSLLAWMGLRGEVAGLALDEIDWRKQQQPSNDRRNATMNKSPDTHNNSMTSWIDAPTRTLSAGEVEFAYRQLGPGTGVPVIFLTHLAAVLDNWDPRVVDGIAAQHRLITFDNRGVGASSGSTPTTIQEMARTPSPSSAPSASTRLTSSGSPWAA